jgi:hypothetical protein
LTQSEVILVTATELVGGPISVPSFNPTSSVLSIPTPEAQSSVRPLVTRPGLIENPTTTPPWTQSSQLSVTPPQVAIPPPPTSVPSDGIIAPSILSIPTFNQGSASASVTGPATPIPQLPQDTP